MKIPAWLAFAVKVAIFLFGFVASAAASSPEHFGGAAMAGNIAYYSTLTSTGIALLSMLVGSGAVPSQTVVGKVAVWALGFLVFVSLLAPHSASAEPARTLSQIVSDLRTQVATINGKVTTLNSKVGLTGSATTDANALVSKLQAISLTDLKAAKADADGTHDTLASNCYGPLIDLVTAQQAVVTPGQNSDNSGASVPTTHLILDFQRARDLRNALQPTSPVGIGCSPMAQQVKLDLISFIGQIAAGSVSLATFGL